MYKNTNQYNQRNLSIDLIKIIAMFAVIGLHTFKASYGWRTANIFYESCVIAIPLFFMASGYQLLGRTNIDFRYVLRKIWRIAKFVFVIAILIWLIKSYMSMQISPIVWGEIFLGSFIQRGTLWMCWYFGSMIIIYALLPILNSIFLEKKRLFFALLLLFFILDYLIFIGNLEMEGNPLEMKIIQTFRLWNWLFYFMLGGIIRLYSYILKETTSKKMLFGAIIGLLIINAFFQELLKFEIGSPYCEFFYCSFIVMLFSFFVFVYILNIEIKSSKVITVLSSLFLPVYILHPFSIKGIEDFVPILSESPFILFLSVSIVTVIIASLIMRIPVINAIFKL